MTQKEKTKFRASSKWKKFRVFMKKLFEGKDAITGKPLYKGWNLHHLDEKNYSDLKPEKFIPLNNYVLCRIEVPASKSGIILSDETKAASSSKYLIAEAVGVEVKEVVPGDKLLVNPFTVVSERLVRDETHWLIPESCVAAVERNTNN